MLYAQLLNQISEIQNEINGATTAEQLDELLEQRNELIETLENYTEENELDINKTYDDIKKAMGK